MKATVNIEFESFGDLTTALYETIRAVKKQAKGQLPDKKVMDRSLAEPVPFEFDGDNCYGSFEIVVSTDGTEGDERNCAKCGQPLLKHGSAWNGPKCPATPAPTGEEEGVSAEIHNYIRKEFDKSENACYNFDQFKAGAIAMYHKLWQAIDKQNLGIIGHIYKRQELEALIASLTKEKDDYLKALEDIYDVDYPVQAARLGAIHEIVVKTLAQYENTTRSEE